MKCQITGEWLGHETVTSKGNTYTVGSLLQATEVQRVFIGQQFSGTLPKEREMVTLVVDVRPKADRPGMNVGLVEILPKKATV